MVKEYTNDDVYEFLEEECRNRPDLWKEFGEGILSRTNEVDFWDTLSERMDCFRVCDECGKPMIEGYVVDARDTYCSDECLHKHITDEQFEELSNSGDGDTYYTNWYEDSITFNNNRR